MNFLDKILSLKSVRSTDQFYLDDSGKHVIFRNINGRTVPIQVTAEEYAEWLGEQGIQVDPADQTQLNQIEEQLEVLERAAEISPELQSQYEKAFNQQRQQYYDYANKYYQQALQAESAKTGVKPQDIQHQRKKTYEAAKTETVARNKLPDRGWESYIRAYTNSLIENSGIEKDSKAWYMLQAYDAILANAVSLASQGVSPSSVNFGALLRYEVENGFPSIKDRLTTRYSEYRPDGQEYMFDANIVFGAKNLKENMERKTPAFDELAKMFSEKYSEIYQDFESSKQTFEPMKPLSESGIERKDIPEELPEEFGTEEANSLFGVFRAFKNSPTAGANRVALHALARLYDSLPEKDRAIVAAELSDGSKGLHAVHQAEFMNIWQRKTALGMSVDVEHEVEELLRFSVRAAKLPTRDKVLAMKEIAARLGRIDGINAFSMLNEDNPSFRAFSKKWKDSSLNAGRQKGEGPDLIDSIVDDTARKNSMMKNRTLRLMHKATVKPAPKKDLEVPAEIKKEAAPVAMHGFEKADGSFVSPEGWKLTPDPSGVWSISSPEGAKVGEIFVQKTDNREAAVKARMKALREARKIIDSNLDEPSEPTPEVGLFGFKDAINKNDRDALQELTGFVRESGLDVKTKIPGTVFAITKGDTTVDIIRGKQNGSLFMVQKKGKETITKPTPIDVEAIKGIFTAEASPSEQSKKSANYVPGLSFSHRPR